MVKHHPARHRLASSAARANGGAAVAAMTAATITMLESTH